MTKEQAKILLEVNINVTKKDKVILTNGGKGKCVPLLV
jgi:hypothetical protein